MAKILFVAQNFHDIAMGPVRLRRMVRYLQNHGHDVTVLTAPAQRTMDLNLPSGVRIIDVAAVDLSATYKKLLGHGQKKQVSGGNIEKPKIASRTIGLTSFINRWFMIPDKQAPWMKPALKRAEQLFTEQSVDVVFASLAPKTSCTTASRVAKKHGIPFVAEYRDLWTGSMYHNLDQPTGLHRLIHCNLERRVLANATRVTSVCQGICDYLRKTYPKETAGKLSVHYNFYDPIEYPPVPEAKAGRFTILYAGAMYLNRSPDMFFEGLRLFIDRNRLTPEEVSFRWIGRIVAVPGIQEMIDDRNLMPFIDFRGQVPHREALAQLLECHVSLLIQAPDDDVHIPGKLFEALGARLPLLAIANPCEVTEIIDRTQSGLHCPYHAEAVADTLERFYRHWQNGRAWEFNETETETYSSDAMMQRIASLFESVCAQEHD